jgi:mxaK protein
MRGGRLRGVLRAAGVLCLALGLLAAADGAWRMARYDALRREAALLLAGVGPAPAAGADAVLVAAHATYLARQGNTDAAQAAADLLTAPGDREARARLLATLGNARLRQAMTVYSSLPFRKVKPMIEAARYDEREAVHLDPSLWAARYNYALASELLPEREEYLRSSGTQMSHDRAVWPDLPGVPNGMP